MEKLCEICKKELLEGEEAVTCPDCGKVYHKTCWDTNGGCAVPECIGKANAEKESSKQNDANGSESEEKISAQPESDSAGSENENSDEPLSESVQPETVNQISSVEPKKDKSAKIKSLLKKWWFWTFVGIVVLSIVLISTCSKSEAAKAVIDQIETVSQNVTAYSDSSIKSVEDQYKALTDEEKKQISNYDDLVEARNKCDELIADDIENQISGISSDSDIDRILRVHSEYDDLTENQKKYVLNYKTLIQIEDNYYNDYISAAEDAISSIGYSGGKITDDQLEAIETAIEACGEVPDTYQKKISNYKTLVKAIDDRDAYHLKAAQELIDKAIEKNKGFSEAENAYNALPYDAKNEIENYDKFSEMYTEYKNKPPIKIQNYRVSENSIGNPEIYISAKNVSGKIIKEFSVGFFAWDKDGVPVSLGYNDYMRTLSCDEALKVDATLPGNICWTFYGMYSKSNIQQAVIIVKDVEYFDGTIWENPSYGTLCEKYCQQLLEKGDSNIAKRG